MTQALQTKVDTRHTWCATVLGKRLITNTNTRRGVSDIMNRTPTDPAVIVYLCPELKPEPNQSTNDLTSEYERLIGNVRIHPISRFQELLSIVQTPEFSIDWIAIDLEHLQTIHGASMFDLVRTVHTLLRCTTCDGQPRSARIVGVVGDTTDPALIREAMTVPEFATLALRHGGSIGYDQCIADTHRYLHGDMTISAQIREWSKTQKKRAKKSSGSIHLTPRQAQILDLVSTRGASNKVIARMLSISESTVKLHVSAILKKYGCRNRTQLAVFSRQQKDKETA